MDFEFTNRGFGIAKFKDRNGVKCSLQESSIATESCIWLGCDEHGAVQFTPYAKPSWKLYPIPDDVNINTRMHLTQEQVAELLPALIHFAEHGELPSG